MHRECGDEFSVRRRAHCALTLTPRAVFTAPQGASVSLRSVRTGTYERRCGVVVWHRWRKCSRRKENPKRDICREAHIQQGPSSPPTNFHLVKHSSRNNRILGRCRISLLIFKRVVGTLCRENVR